MPIYKGAVEVTSGNLYKGSTEIENAYKGSDSFFINETSLTITFTDNTPTGASVSNVSSIVLNGTPGASITQQLRTVTRSANFTITTPTVTKTGDSNNNLSVATSLTGSTGFQNGLLTITGTFPSTSVTINLAVTCSTTAKTVRTIATNANMFAILQPNGGTVDFNPTWSGGNTGFITGSGLVNAAGVPQPQGTITYAQTSGSSVDGRTLNSSGKRGIIFFSAGGSGLYVNASVNVSVSENATHASASATTTRVF